MEVELPNGVVLSDIPEGTTKAQVMAKAISAGLATETDFGVSPSAPVDQSNAETARLNRGASPKEAPKPRSTFDELTRQLGLTARATGTALTDLPAMVLDPVVSGVNAVAGKEVIPPTSTAVQRFMTMAGLPEPENKLERAVQRGASAVGGVGAQAKLATALGSQALAPLTRELGQQAAAAGAAATTSQAASEKFDEEGFSPAANFAATLATGLLAGGVAAKGVRSATTPKTPQLTMADVKQQAERAYTRVDDSGITVKPKPLLDTVDRIENRLINSEGFNPELASHKEVQTLLDQMRRMVGTQRVSFQKMDQMRQAAVKLSRENTDAATRRLANVVVSGIDDKITSLQPQELMTGKGNLSGALKDVKEARDAWKRAAKATLLEDALNVAEARALAPSASEGELIRTQFKQIAANKEKMRLFNSAEQAAIRRVVNGSGVETLLSMAAKFNPERSQLMAGAQIAGAFTNPVLSGSVAVGGFGADKALGALQNSKANKTISNILSGSTTQPRSVTEANLRALFESRENPGIGE